VGETTSQEGIYPIYPVCSSLPQNIYREILEDLASVSGGYAFNTDWVLALRFKDDPSYHDQEIDHLIQVSPLVLAVDGLGQFKRVVLDRSGVTFTLSKGTKKDRSRRSQQLWKKPCSTPEEIKMLARRLTLLNPDIHFEQHLEQLTRRPSDLRLADAHSDGLVIPYGLASQYFVNDGLGMVCRMQGYCLLSKSTITQPVLQQVLAAGFTGVPEQRLDTCDEPLAVFATEISHAVVVFLVVNKLRGFMLSAAIVCPEAELKRIAAYLGADFPNIDDIRNPADLRRLPWIALTASAWGESIIERKAPSPKKRRKLS